MDKGQKGNRPTFQFVAVRHYHLFEQRDWQPALNIYETTQEVVLVVELAGIDPKHLVIDAEPDKVRIQGQRHARPPANLRRIHRMEMVGGTFQIEVALAVMIDPEHAGSRYQNGLLEIRLPLAQHTPQHITIDAEQATNAERATAEAGEETYDHTR